MAINVSNWVHRNIEKIFQISLLDFNYLIAVNQLNICLVNPSDAQGK